MRRDAGTITPLIAGAVVIAWLVATASAAFLAQRDLAGFCDGAAVAAAAAATMPDADGDPALDPERVDGEVARYGAGSPTTMNAATDGRTVTVVCGRRVDIPFGAVLGAPDGLDRTVTARARPVLR